MRRHAFDLAKSLPPKSTTEILVPWLALAFTVVAGAFALYQYYSANQAQRVYETIKLHREFIGLSPDGQSAFSLQKNLIDLNERLGRVIDTERCNYIRELIQDGSIADMAPVDCQAEDAAQTVRDVNLNERQRAVLRGRIEKGQEQLQPGERDRLNLYRILGFYSAVVTCAKQRGCNTDSVIELFASHMVDFANAYCTFFEKVARNWNNKSVDDDLVHFLVSNGVATESVDSSDPHRNYVFRCDRHRAIEDSRTRLRFMNLLRLD